MVPGQQPKVLDSHATVVVPALPGTNGVRRDVTVVVVAAVVVEDTLVATVNRGLLVVRQLDPALSRLFTVVPGQQPKVLEAHANAVVPERVTEDVAPLFVTTVNRVSLVVDRNLLVVGQLDPSRSRLFTVVPGQQPKVLDSHATVVVPAPPGTNGVRRDVTVVVAAAVVVEDTLVATVDRGLLVVRQLDPALSCLFTVVPGQQPKVLEAHATVVVPALVADGVVLRNATVVVTMAVVRVAPLLVATVDRLSLVVDSVFVVVGQLDPARSRLFTVVPGQQPKVLEAQATVVVPALVADDVVLLNATVVVTTAVVRAAPLLVATVDRVMLID